MIANPASARPTFARRQYLVDPRFQLKYTLILVTVGAVLSLLFGAMMYQAHVEATQLMELPEPYRSVVSSQDSTQLWLVLAISALMAIALGLFGILVTHRVAGPIFVFSHYMNVLGQGRYPQLRPLRKGDELKDFYDVFYEAVGAMKERDRSDAEELQLVVRSLEAAASRAPELAETLKPAIQKTRELSERMREAAASEEPATPGQKMEAAIKSAAVA